MNQTTPVYDDDTGYALAAVVTPWDGCPTERPLTALATFAVAGSARFLSHAQLVRVFERACVRADLPVGYSQGFNPHLRLSLPLPKSVGLAVCEDVLCVRVGETPTGTPDDVALHWRTALSAALVPGVTIGSLQLVEGKGRFYPRQATYWVPTLRTEPAGQRLETALAAVTWPAERTGGGRRQPNKHVDLRPYLGAGRVAPAGLTLDCRITDRGTIRVDEIMTLLGLEPEDLQGPVQRTEVRWQAPLGPAPVSQPNDT